MERLRRMGIKRKLKDKIRYIKRNIIFFLYKKLYNINLKGIHGTMTPSLGKGLFVSVYRKKDIIDIVSENHDNNEMVRIIPYKENHGIMVERWRDGNMIARDCLDLRMLMEDIRYVSNFDIFVDKIKYDRRIINKQRKDKLNKIMGDEKND